MNLTSKRVSYHHSAYGGHLKIFTTLTEAQEAELNKLNDYADNGGEISIEVKKKTKKRSLDANAYMWVLLHKMADDWAQRKMNCICKFWNVMEFLHM